MQYIGEATYNQFPIRLVEVVFSIVLQVIAAPREHKIKTILAGNSAMLDMAKSARESLC